MFAPLSALGNHISILLDYQPEKPRVLVIGYGWASSAFTERLDPQKYSVKVIAPTPARLNQPSMVSLLDKSKARLQPYRLYKHPPTRLLIEQDTCQSIHESEKTVQGLQKAYPYDYLVIAAGSEPNDFGIKGVQEHCQMFKSATDFEKLQHRNPDLPVTVLGAGPTGVELAFKLKSLGHAVTIIEASPTILPGFSIPFQTKVLNYLRHQDIQLRLECPVSQITQDAIESAKTNQRIVRPDQDLLIWTCGIRPVPFIRSLGTLSVNDQLQWKPSIYMIGDAISSKRPPPTAQNAKQQGYYLADLFNSNFKQQTPYKYNEFGKALDITTGYLIEIQGYCVYVPYFLRPLIDWVRE